MGRERISRSLAASKSGGGRDTSGRLAAALEGTSDCVMVLDRDWRVIFLNSRAAAQLPGGERLLGQDIRVAYPAFSEGPFWSAFDETMNTRRPRRVEAFSAAIGSWFEAHVAPIDDGATVFFRNIDRRKRAQAALEESGNRFRSILDHMPQIVWSTRPDGYHDYYSRNWYAFTGTEPGATDGHGYKELLHPDDRERAAEAWRYCLATGEPYEIEYRIRNRDGEHIWMIGRATPERDESGEIVRWYGTCTDIHQQVLAKQALDASEALNRSMVEASPDCIKLLDLAGRLLFINEAGARTLGASSGAALAGQAWADWFGGEEKKQARRALARARRGRIGRMSAMLPGKAGAATWWDVVATPVPGPDGKPHRILVISRDISEQKKIEEKVRWTAQHDSLTDLPNRSLFQQRLDERIAAGAASGGFALLLLDLDDFKRTNDTLGHDAGDALLCGVAERLRRAVRPEDLVARLGGDEFAVILDGAGDERQVRAAAQSVFRQLQEPCVHRGRILDFQATIGASIFDPHGSSRAELMKQADIALYVAKAGGGGAIELFRPEMRAEMQRRTSMLALARTALRENLIVPHYQPKVDFGNGRLAGFEALLRWNHPERGPQGSDTVAAAFEDLNLAAQLSDRMIDLVIADARRWLDEGIGFGHVAINAAAAEFRRGDFAERLLARLEREAVPPACLQLEVTETVFLGRGAEYVERALKLLSTAGVKIALDDFGTGYASLSHLKRFPVDVLKIDRSFVRDFHEDPEDAAIVRAVINLGRSLGIDVVAEGIETPLQATLLAAHGCGFGQGFLYGAAAPADDVAALIRAWRPAADRDAGSSWPLKLAG